MAPEINLHTYLEGHRQFLSKHESETYDQSEGSTEKRHALNYAFGMANRQEMLAQPHNTDHIPLII